MAHTNISIREQIKMATLIGGAVTRGSGKIVRNIVKEGFGPSPPRMISLN
jgi:hypothetical protein